MVTFPRHGPTMATALGNSWEYPRGHLRLSPHSEELSEPHSSAPQLGMDEWWWKPFSPGKNIHTKRQPPWALGPISNIQQPHVFGFDNFLGQAAFPASNSCQTPSSCWWFWPLPWLRGTTLEAFCSPLLGCSLVSWLWLATWNMDVVWWSSDLRNIILFGT